MYVYIHYNFHLSDNKYHKIDPTEFVYKTHIAHNY